jgi:hypothetical protein
MVNMRFRKFDDFLKEREVSESNGSLNRTALDYDKKLAQFNARFSDPQQGENIVKAAGYKSVGAFVMDSDQRKWSKLRIPGQENYVR